MYYGISVIQQMSKDEAQVLIDMRISDDKMSWRVAVSIYQSLSCRNQNYVKRRLANKIYKRPTNHFQDSQVHRFLNFTA